MYVLSKITKLSDYNCSDAHCDIYASVIKLYVKGLNMNLWT